MKMKKTTYSTAVNFLHNNFIMCNNLPSIDESIWDNAHFELYHKGEGEDEDSEYPIEIYQYFLTSCSEGDVEFLERNFPDLLFTYSDLLGLYVLCVDHWGTSWHYVDTSVSEDSTICEDLLKDPEDHRKD